MGKGDRRTRRGKIYAGSFGKLRPKKPKPIVKTVAPRAAKAPVSKVTAKPAARRAKA